MSGQIAGQMAFPGLAEPVKRRRVRGAPVVRADLLPVCRFCKRLVGAHAGGLGCAS